MKLSGVCLVAVLALTGCATHAPQENSDASIQSGWARSTLFTLDKISATRNDLLTISLRLYDTDTGKQLATPVVVARSGEPFGVSVNLPDDSSAPVQSGARLVLEGRVDVVSDELGRRIAEYKLSGRDHSGRQHKASGSTTL